jgi:uncharacterized membrane protein HdeD (DUF308 family)
VGFDEGEGWMAQQLGGDDLTQRVSQIVSKYWWVLLLRGIAAIVFGILAIALPGLTLFMLVITFGIYTLFDGVIEIWSGFSTRDTNDRWWTDILIGVAGVIAGILIMALPGVTAVVAIYFIGAWMVVTGVLQIIAALRLRQEISNEWWLVLSGVLSVIIGLYFLAFPGDGAVSLVWIIGIYAILFGAMLVVLAFRARKGFN